jgi:cold shock CspA family protein
MTRTGTMAWFDLAEQFDFVALSNGHGDAFLHMSALKEAGYVWLPRGPRCGSGSRMAARGGGGGGSGD